MFWNGPTVWDLTEIRDPEHFLRERGRSLLLRSVQSTINVPRELFISEGFLWLREGAQSKEQTAFGLGIHPSVVMERLDRG